MAISNIKASLPYDVEKVWNIVTSLHDYSWRKDLREIEILSESKFIEHTVNGYSTTFTITILEPYSRYEFDMENENMSGHWIGIFSFDGENTVVDFTEDVRGKKLLMKAFVKMYLRKQQNTYIAYLKEALEEK